MLMLPLSSARTHHAAFIEVMLVRIFLQRPRNGWQITVLNPHRQLRMNNGRMEEQEFRFKCCWISLARTWLQADLQASSGLMQSFMQLMARTYNIEPISRCLPVNFFMGPRQTWRGIYCWWTIMTTDQVMSCMYLVALVRLLSAQIMCCLATSAPWQRVLLTSLTIQTQF